MSAITDYYAGVAEHIRPGSYYTLYLEYCTKCGIFKVIRSSPPIAPGGIPSCPVCKDKGEKPQLEGAYGHVKVKPFHVELPKSMIGE